MSHHYSRVEIKERNAQTFFFLPTIFCRCFSVFYRQAFNLDLQTLSAETDRGKTSQLIKAVINTTKSLALHYHEGNAVSPITKQ